MGELAVMIMTPCGSLMNCESDTEFVVPGNLLVALELAELDAPSCASARRTGSEIDSILSAARWNIRVAF